MVDMMVLKKFSIGGCAGITDRRLLTSGMSIFLKQFESPSESKSYWILANRPIIGLNTIDLTQ